MFNRYIKLFLSTFNVSIKYEPLLIGSTSAISSELILYSKILSKSSWVIGEPDFRKISLLDGFDRLFFIYFPKK